MDNVKNQFEENKFNYIDILNNNENQQKIYEFNINQEKKIEKILDLEKLNKNKNEKNKSNIFIVGGLLFGDEGKGTTVEFLANQYNCKLVVRYGGGPQAAHHVVKENKTWHCFSQLGSGTFEPNCDTLLSKYMLINPITLEKEIEVISKKDISQKEVMERLFVDKKCFIITPYHKLITISKEILRKKNSHGSTGLGVGVAIDEAMYSNLDFFPKAKICYEKEKSLNLNQNFSNIDSNSVCLQIIDFYDRNNFFNKLKNLIEEKLNQVKDLIDQYYKENEIDPILTSDDKYINEVKNIVEKFKTEFSLVKLLKIYIEWFEKFKLNFVDGIDIMKNKILNQSNIIFEGSQGSLLDRIYGYYPHLTKSLCTDDNAQNLLDELKDFNLKVIKIGVLRLYSSRHGKGPFVTNNHNWNNFIKEDHNIYGRFNGDFKIGPFDLMAAKYGIEIFKPDFISLTCVDKIGLAYEKNKENQIFTEEKNILYKKFYEIDYIVCNGYLLDYLKENLNKQKSKNKINKERNILKKEIETILEELTKNKILEILEFNSKEDIEKYLFKENNKNYCNDNPFKNYYIDENNFFEKYKNKKIILINKINLGNDFFNFKNENLAKILNNAKPLFYKLKDTNSYIFSNLEEKSLIIENMKNIEIFFENKLKINPNNQLKLIQYILNIEKELKTPINILSLGPTKIDKILLN